MIYTYVCIYIYIYVCVYSIYIYHYVVLSLRINEILLLEVNAGQHFRDGSGMVKYAKMTHFHGKDPMSMGKYDDNPLELGVTCSDKARVFFT